MPTCLLFQVTGGRNGYGAKLANIFSTQFTIETCDGTRLKRYKQVFHDNMSRKDVPKVEAKALPCVVAQSYCCAACTRLP